MIHENKYGIYALDSETQETELVYSSDQKITKIRLNNTEDCLVFSQDFGESGEGSVSGCPVNLNQEIKELLM